LVIAFDSLEHALVFVATHVHDPQFAHRFDTLRPDLDGSREHLLGWPDSPHHLIEPSQQEVGLLPILRQLDAFPTMLESFTQHDFVVRVTEV